jgi:hypothetical protein
VQGGFPEKKMWPEKAISSVASSGQTEGDFLMTKSNLSIANELTISRREVLTFATSSFIATQMP